MNFNASIKQVLPFIICFHLITEVLYQLDRNRNKAYIISIHFIEMSIHIFESYSHWTGRL